MNKSENKLQHYKDNIYYMYKKSDNVWCFSDNEDINIANISYICAKQFIFPEALNMFKNWYRNNVK